MQYCHSFTRGVSIFVVLYVIESCFRSTTAGRARGNFKEEAANADRVDAERISRNGVSVKGKINTHACIKLTCINLAELFLFLAVSPYNFYKCT